MASARFAVIKSPSATGWLLILPVKGQKVKGVGPSPLEVGVRSREPTRMTDRTAITARFRHDLKQDCRNFKACVGLIRLKWPEELS